jgi:hypothetical protein
MSILLIQCLELFFLWQVAAHWSNLFAQCYTLISFTVKNNITKQCNIKKSNKNNNTAKGCLTPGQWLIQKYHITGVIGTKNHGHDVL